MTNYQEPEGSSSLYSSYSYELDFIGADVLPVEPSVSLIQRFFDLFSPIKNLIFTIFTLTWQTVVFSATFVVYIQKKLVAFVYFLESLKDTLVKVLMWRRGLLFRPTTHGGLLAIGSVALVVGSLFQTSVAPQDYTRDLVLAASNTTETIVPTDRPRSEVIKVKVKGGETLSALATTYSVSVDSIKWANGLDSDAIKPNDEIAIPPVTGMIHKVKSGDTLASIATLYKANAQSIADYPFNYIDESLSLKVDQTLFVPDGVKPAPVPVARPAARPGPAFVAAGSGFMTWPVPAGRLSQYPSWWHPAVDIAAPYGSAIYSTREGRVLSVSFQSYGFGNYILVDHGNGYTAAYAHMSSIGVGAGQLVGRGQYVGAVGCSGRCTGPHLHLEVRRDGTAVNPLSLF